MDVAKVSTFLAWKNETARLDVVLDVVFTLKKQGYKYGVMQNFSRKLPKIWVISRVFYRVGGKICHKNQSSSN